MISGRGLHAVLLSATSKFLRTTWNVKQAAHILVTEDRQAFQLNSTWRLNLGKVFFPLKTSMQLPAPSAVDKILDVLKDIGPTVHRTGNVLAR